MLSDKLSFRFSLSHIKGTLARFPVSVACSVIGFCLMVGLAHIHIVGNDEIPRAIAILTCGYFWFGSLRLAAEGNGGRHEWYMIAGAVLFAGVVYMLGVSPQWHLHFLFLLPALLLFLSIAPFGKGGDDFSFWFYNYRLWLGAAAASAAGIVLALGLCALVTSLHYLFNVDTDDKIYADIWYFASLLFTPFCALAWTPRQFVYEETACEKPPGLEFIVNWVLAPLVLLYLALLYAYFIKIVVTMEVPRGQLSLMITGFGCAGIATYLIGWPLRHNGAPALRLFYKWFFPALSVPVAMQLYAGMERIHQYGVTEQRYAIILAALWFGGLALLFTLRRPTLKFMPLGIAVLLALASFGPWGAVNVSGVSQFHRLERLLLKDDILQNGQVVKAPGTVPFEDRRNISSLLSYMQETQRAGWLRPWFGKPDPNMNLDVPGVMTTAMGFEYVGEYESENAGNSFAFFNTNKLGFLNITGYDYMFPDINPAMAARDAGAGAPRLTTLLKDGMIHIDVGGRTLDADLKAFLKTKIGPDRSVPGNSLVMVSGNDGMTATFVITSMQANLKDGEWVVAFVNFDLFVDMKP